MPVFDFSNATTEKKDPECTYTTFRSNETKPSPENQSWSWTTQAASGIIIPVAYSLIQTRNLLLNSKKRMAYSRQISSRSMHVS